MNNPYAPPVANVADPEAPASTVRFAGFWRRFWAFCIDIMLLIAIILPILLKVYGINVLMDEHRPFILGPAHVLVSYVFPFLATIVFWKFRQATPGKMLVGLKIVDARTLGPMGNGQLLGRYFAYLAASLPLAIGLLWVAWDGQKQGWHDKLAGTFVIRN